MIALLGQIWARHKFLLFAFILALAVTIFFATRFVFFSIYWSDPAHRNQPLEGWMTPRYVARSYHQPVEVIISLLEISPEDFKRRPTLAIIARAKGEPLDVLLANLATRLATLEPQQ